MSLVEAIHDENDDDDADDDVKAEAAERWGLVWDPEEGPVWGNIGGTEEQKQEDTWTQLLKEGVNGITTDRDGGDRNNVFYYCFKRMMM